jgi:hypothetical protein
MHVHGVGIGPKITDGVVQPETIAVRVYVIQKLPLDALPAEAILPGEIDGVPIDVIESAPAFLAPENQATPPPTGADCTGRRQAFRFTVIGGISTGVAGSAKKGTIACFCRSTRVEDNGAALVLSNSHIYVDGGQQHLVQPATGDGPMDNPFAKLLRATTIQLGGQVANEVDAAVGQLAEGRPHRQEICSLGPIRGTDLPATQMLVQIHGRTSGPSEGIIDDISYDGLFGEDPDDPSTLALFVNQIRIRGTNGAFATGGDSGSLVIRREDQGSPAIGLLFASSADRTYGTANPIGKVFEALEIDLP